VGRVARQEYSACPVSGGDLGVHGPRLDRLDLDVDAGSPMALRIRLRHTAGGKSFSDSNGGKYGIWKTRSCGARCTMTVPSPLAV
jgi:hypothetical protein